MPISVFGGVTRYLPLIAYVHCPQQVQHRRSLIVHAFLLTGRCGRSIPRLPPRWLVYALFAQYTTGDYGLYDIHHASPRGLGAVFL